jgi:deoxyribose-phosphate aldolase
VTNVLWAIADKATGGIRFYEDALALIDAGASRIGASRTEAILASRLETLKAAR